MNAELNIEIKNGEHIKDTNDKKLKVDNTNANTNVNNTTKNCNKNIFITVDRYELGLHVIGDCPNNLSSSSDSDR